MSPVPNAIDASRLGVGSAVTTTTCGKRPLRLRTKFRASDLAFCARSLRIVHLHHGQDSFSADARQFQRTTKHDRYHSSPYLTANQNLGHDQENFVMTKKWGGCGLMQDRLSPVTQATQPLIEGNMPRLAFQTTS